MLVRHIGWVDRPILIRIDALSFRTFMPALLFYNIYTSDLSKDFNAKMVVFSLISLFVIVGLSVVIVPKLEPSNPKRAALCQAIMRSNFVLFGVAVTDSLYGPGKASTVSLLSAVLIPVMNAIAVILLEYYRGGHVKPKALFFSVLKNPLVIASACGLVTLLMGITLPAVIQEVIKDLAGVTTPLCFLTLGGSLSIAGFSKNIRQLAVGLTARMVLIPLVFLTLSVLLGFRQMDLAALMVMFAAPTAVSTFTMAQQMGADGELAGQLVAGSTLLSVLTIFVLTFTFKTMGIL